MIRMCLARPPGGTRLRALFSSTGPGKRPDLSSIDRGRRRKRPPLFDVEVFRVFDEGEEMTEYVILIHGDESRWEALSAAERSAVDDAHRAFSEKAAGRVRAAGELQATSTGVAVRTGADGEPRATDGPFAESKEVVGGFYVIEADDRDEVVALAASLAEARQGHGGIEVRPLVGRG